MDDEVTRFPFLSDEWFEAVAGVLAEHDVGAGAKEVMMNLVVTDTPFGERRELHLGSRSGEVIWGRETHEEADLTLTVDYVTAKDVFVGGNAQVGMQAFMAGKVTVQGDLTKLMAVVQGEGAGPGNAALAAMLQSITE